MILKKSDFDFQLPEHLIAQTPLKARSASRLLCLDGKQKHWRDSLFSQLSDWLEPGDMLVFNDTKVLPARLFGVKAGTGGAVEILIERVTGPQRAIAQLNTSNKPGTGSHITLENGTDMVVTWMDGEFYQLDFAIDESLEDFLFRAGHMPLPPYITRDDSAYDRSRYQTVYARHTGAVAAPTAGLHFDQPLLETLNRQGIKTGYVTLHVGAGTFKPMYVEDIEQHHMHREWLEVTPELVESIQQTRADGGRVIAVGTTTVRSLESASQQGQLAPFRGETDIFIYPGYRFHAIDGLITNFHLPQSTLIMLVSAFAGRELTLAAYQHAIEAKYRFFSYGDAMLIMPASPDSIA